MNISPLTQAMFQAGISPSIGIPSVPGTSFLDTVARGLENAREVSSAGEVSKTQSLEDRLRAKYPNLAYHVFDASSRYWRTRNDYPHYLLYQQGDEAKKTLENWKPTGPNPFYGSVDGKFTAPKEIHALAAVPPGSVAVVIHPKVQERMEQDPAYADEIYKRIEAWFAFDAARNEAMIPGISLETSKSIAIGEDGQIANAQSCSGGRVTQSKSGDDGDGEDFWEARARRFRLYMDQVVEAQILHKLGLTMELSARRSVTRKAARISTSSGNSEAVQRLAAMQQAQAAASQTTAMMNDPAFREALGDTIAGVSIDAVFQSTAEHLAQGPYII